MSNVQVLLFQGTWIIAKVSRVEPEEFNYPDCVLEYPYEIQGTEITPWPAWSGDVQVAVRSSDIAVMVDPSLFILEKYRDFIEEENL